MAPSLSCRHRFDSSAVAGHALFKSKYLTLSDSLGAISASIKFLLKVNAAIISHNAALPIPARLHPLDLCLRRTPITRRF